MCGSGSGPQLSIHIYIYIYISCWSGLARSARSLEGGTPKRRMKKVTAARVAKVAVTLFSLPGFLFSRETQREAENREEVGSGPHGASVFFQSWEHSRLSQVGTWEIPTVLSF